MDKSLAGGQKRLRGKRANDSVLGPKCLKSEGTFPTIDPLITRSLESSKALCPGPSLMVISLVMSHIHSLYLGNVLDHNPHQYPLQPVYDLMISHPLSYLFS